jgi:putative NADPH-quinone reductase
MIVSILLANPKSGSFCHALAQTASSVCKELGHRVRFHDLQAEGFNPILGERELLERVSSDPHLEQHCSEIKEADVILVVHPNWWGQPPAILKGWVDRVLRTGVAYEFLEGDGGEGVPRGLLKAKVAIVLNTSDTPLEREQAIFGDPLETLWGRCIFPYCGVDRMVRHTYGVVVNSTPEEREAWLEHARGLVREALLYTDSISRMHGIFVLLIFNFVFFCAEVSRRAKSIAEML